MTCVDDTTYNEGEAQYFSSVDMNQGFISSRPYIQDYNFNECLL